MTALQLAQISAAILTTVTPLVVVLVAWRTAARHARAVDRTIARPSSVATVAGLTIAAALIVVVIAAWLPAPSPWMFLVDGLAFVTLATRALRTLGHIEEASAPARVVNSAVREASLAVRRAGDYLPWAWRFAVYGLALAGLATFAGRLALPGDGRRLLTPIIFALGSFVFLWLYEVWIQDVVAGPAVSGGSTEQALRRGTVRGIFAAEVALVCAGLISAHILVDLNWTTHGGLGAAVSLTGGLIGVVGCALALSSGLRRQAHVSQS